MQALRFAPSANRSILAVCVLVLITNIFYLLLAMQEIEGAIYGSAAFYFAGFVYIYATRKNKFSFFMLMSFIYSMVFGLPSVAWILRNPINNIAQADVLLGILTIGNLLTFLSHCESQNRRRTEVTVKWEPKTAFVAVLCIVFLAQSYKLYMYLGVLSASAYGHLAIWVESERLLNAVPIWVRILSGGSLLMGIVGISLFRKRRFMQFACLVLILSDMALGIRNKGFFGTLSAIYILSLFEWNQASRLFQRMSSPIMLGIAFVALSIVSYLREGFTISLSDYLVIVLDSLASIVNGLLKFVSGGLQCHYLDGTLVLSQFWTLLGIGNGRQVSAVFNYCLTGNPNPLTSLSSSMVLEMLLAVGPIWPLACGIYILIIYFTLRFLEGFKTIVSLSLLCAVAPSILYTLRAELVQPIIYVIKGLPYILMIGVLVRRTEQPDLI